MSDSHSTALLMLLVLARLPSLSESVAFRPQPTGLTAQSPVTDAAPKPTLFARDEHTLIGSSQTCGYFDQDADDPYGCSGSSMCAYVSADSYGGGDWGPFCCDPFDASCPTPMATTCLDYSDDDNPVTAELTAFSTLFCGSISKECGTWYLEGDEWVATSPTYTAYFCAATSTSRYAYQTYDVFVSSNTSQTAVPGPTAPSTGPIGSTTDEAIGSEESTSAPSESDSATISPIPSVPAPSKPNTAAIAGGTVGGVGVLALIFGGIIAWLKHKKKREREEKVPETAN